MGNDNTFFNMAGSDTNWWRYSDPAHENYRDSITGTLVEIKEVQAREFGTNAPKFYPDGNPTLNLRWTLLQQDGEEICWEFNSSKRGKAVEGILAGTMAAGLGTNMGALLGKFLTVSTPVGSYNARNPRPFQVTVHGDGDVAQVRGVVRFERPAQPAPNPAVPPQMPQQPSAAQMAAQRASQSLGFQGYQQQPQPQYAPPQFQEVMTTTSQQPPVGVPYMSAGGAQPAPQPAAYYDQDIPF